MKLSFLCAAASIWALFFAGCVEVEYVGQKFPPRPEGSYVAFFNSVKELPQGYRVVGRGTMDEPDSVTAGELREKLLRKAEEIGADAVCITSFQRSLVSVYDAPENEPEQVTGAGWGTGGTTGDGTRVYVNTFGQPQQLQTRRVERFRILVKAEFLLTDEHFAVEMARLKKIGEAERKAEREDKTVTPADVMAAEKSALDARDAELLKKEGKLLPPKEAPKEAQKASVPGIGAEEKSVPAAPAGKEVFESKTPTFHNIE